MEVRQVRTDEIKLIKIDEPEVNIRYIGRSSSLRGATSDAIWQILRQYKNGDIITSTYALMGEFKGVWDDRSTYFDAATPDPSNPLDDLTATISGGISISGQSGAGKITVVSINNSTWTKIPTTNLTGRNTFSIQNYSGQEIKYNYDNTVVGYVGIRVPDSSDRFIDIASGISVYAKSSTSTVDIEIEEISS